MAGDAFLDDLGGGVGTGVVNDDYMVGKVGNTVEDATNLAGLIEAGYNNSDSLALEHCP